MLTETAKTRIINDLEKFHEDPPPGIFVESDENCIQNALVMMIGPEGTPYEGGFFFFELRFPADYPFQPPRVEIRTSDPLGRLRFNPNLYINGKVCLSILSTWPGPKWSPIQTLTSCLISIHSLMNEMPLENEPGYDRVGRRQKLAYNEAITQLVLKVAVVRQLRGHLPKPTMIPKAMGSSLGQSIDLSFDIFVSRMMTWFREHYPMYLHRCNRMGRDRLEIRLDSHTHYPEPDRIMRDLEDLGIVLGVAQSMPGNQPTATTQTSSTATTISAPNFPAPSPPSPLSPLSPLSPSSSHRKSENSTARRIKLPPLPKKD